jgi:hypothetical protein
MLETIKTVDGWRVAINGQPFGETKPTEIAAAQYADRLRRRYPNGLDILAGCLRRRRRFVVLFRDGETETIPDAINSRGAARDWVLRRYYPNNQRLPRGVKILNAADAGFLRAAFLMFAAGCCSIGLATVWLVVKMLVAGLF